MRDRFVLRWVVVGTIGTVLGLGAAGFIGLMGLAAESFSAAVTAGIMFGLAIGVTIGLAQGLLLSGRVEGISSTRWAVYTSAGAALAWAVVAYPIGQLADIGADPGWTARVLGAIVVGLPAGGIVGFVQWRELGRVVPDSWTSIVIQAFAWMIGALILVVADGLLRDQAAQITAVGLAALALAVAGAVVGLIQGIALNRMLPSAAHEITAKGRMAPMP